MSFVAFTTSALAYAIRTPTDFDRSVDFGHDRTFFVLKGNLSDNTLLDQRVADDVRHALMSKGWGEVGPADGQTAIVVHAATKTKRSDHTFHAGWGGWRRWGSATTSPPLVADHKIGTVVVDSFDAERRQAIWHGVAPDALPDRPDAKENATAQAITKLFASFPPGETFR
jgi:hypothetical protein